MSLLKKNCDLCLLDGALLLLHRGLSEVIWCTSPCLLEVTVCPHVLGLLTMTHFLQVCWLHHGHQHHWDFLLKRLQLEICPQGHKGLTCPIATNVSLAETQSSTQSLPVLPGHALVYALTVVPPQALPNPTPLRYHLHGQAQMSWALKAIDEIKIVRHHRCGDPPPHTGQQ